MNRIKASLFVTVLAVGSASAMARDLNASDGAFVKNAWMSSTASFKLGKLAEKRGSTKFIRQFGTMMTNHHKTAAEEARQLAKAEKFDLPDSFGSKYQTLYSRLSKLRGKAFDREYKEAMVLEHRWSYDAFVNARKNASNNNVKNFAERYTPFLQMHLESLQSGKLM